MQRIFVLSLFLITLFTVFCTNILAAEIEVISAIAVEGNKIISTEEILSLIKTKAGDMFDEDKLKADIEAISQLGCFERIKVYCRPYNSGLKAIFQVIEYPVIQDIVFKGNESIDSSQLLVITELKTGEILNIDELVAAEKNIIKKYQDDGYGLTCFTDIDITHEGVIIFEINEGYLNDVVITGNEKTKDFVILRELDIVKGQVLNFKGLQKGFQKIYRLGYFEEIDPDFKRVPNKPGYVNLIIKVKEAKTGNFNTGVSWSSKDGWLGFIDIKERNLLGNGQTLGFDWEFGGATNYSISFYEPWLLGDPTSFGISLYDRSSTRSDSVKGDYDQHRQGGNISLGHHLVGEWDGKIKFKIENSEIEWKNDIYKEENEETGVRSLTLQVNRDTTNNFFNPSEGAIDIVSLEYAGQFLGGDADFTKYNFDFRRFYPGFKDDQVWALNLNAGIGEGDLPELEKYRIGGSETLRGYDMGTFSGNDMLLFKLEYRFPIADKFTGVLFTDLGKTWDSLEEVELKEFNYSAGLGIRMNTPIGLIRFDYGFNKDGSGQPHFSIGQTF